MHERAIRMRRFCKARRQVAVLQNHRSILPSTKDANLFARVTLGNNLAGNFTRTLGVRNMQTKKQRINCLHQWIVNLKV
ncbi:hypothetical protein LBMAG51_00420 [Phycisphaerae bacterium]|nr:hypothetical protein LBMAG51_00420 [Phycisphaerae bacterium]